MADWTNLPNQAVGVGGLPSGTTVTALRDNPVAIAEGAAGAPRVVGDGMNLLIAEVDPSGMAEVVFSDLAPCGHVIEFDTVQPDSTANRAFFAQVSYDGGSTYPKALVLTPSANWRSTADDRLGGVSGMVILQNSFCLIVSGAARSTDNAPLDTLLAGNNLQINKLPIPITNLRIFWNQTSSFRTAANQRIRLYQNGYRPAGPKA